MAPPPGITIDDLVDALTEAATGTELAAPAHPDRPDGWPITWGDQVDLQTLTVAATGTVTDDQAVQHITSQKAGYLAKYATKSTEATGHTSARLTPESVDQYADPTGGHTARLIDACWRLGRPTRTPAPLSGRPVVYPEPGERRAPFDSPWTCPDCGAQTRYAACPSCTAERQASLDTEPAKPAAADSYTRLRRRAHMLGFGGHFLTKARRYSTTFGQLRAARVEHRRHADDHQADQRTTPPTDGKQAEHTVLLVGTLTFAGVGWHTTGDALLANTAAALARARHEVGREELAYELSTAKPTAA
ncbi:hypothetical protein KRM28CT15_04880 [Krasilnikovia sp. M28-CT-15]